MLIIVIKEFHVLMIVLIKGTGFGIQESTVSERFISSYKFLNATKTVLLTSRIFSS